MLGRGHGLGGEEAVAAPAGVGRVGGDGHVGGAVGAETLGEEGGCV